MNDFERDAEHRELRGFDALLERFVAGEPIAVALRSLRAQQAQMDDDRRRAGVALWIHRVSSDLLVDGEQQLPALIRALAVRSGVWSLSDAVHSLLVAHEAADAS